MSATIASLQGYVAGLLSAQSTLAAAHVAVIQDDGTYPKTPGREAALRDHGLVLTVGQIQSNGVISYARTGSANISLYCPVIIEETTTKNRAVGGTGITSEQCLDIVMNTVSGKPTGGPPAQPFLLTQDPFHNFGTIGGMRRMVVNFVTQYAVKPS